MKYMKYKGKIVKNKDKSRRITIQNNKAAIKLMWKYSPKFLIFTGILKLLGYFEWIFFSAFFLRFIIEALEQKESLGSIILFVAVVGIVEGGVVLFTSFVNMKVIPVEQIVIADRMNDDIIKKARSVDLKCFDDSDYYNKYTLAMDGAEQKLMNIVQNIWGCIFGALTTIVAFIIMFKIDRIVGVFVAFPLIGNFLFGSILGKLVFKRNNDLARYRRRISYINRIIYLREYSKEIRLSNVYRLLQKKYRDALEGIGQVSKKYVVKGVALHWFKSIFTFSIIFEGTMLYGAYKTLVVNSMQLSELAIVSSMMVSTTWILIGFADSVAENIRDAFFISNYWSFINYKSDIPEDYEGITPPSNIEEIEFKHVSFSYKDKKILKDISFVLNSDGIYAFVGNNGAGKTTIIKLLLRFYDPDEGIILVNGHDIRKYNLKDYRRLFATAFQEQVLFPISIKEFIQMGSENTQGSVEDSIEKVGLGSKMLNYSKGVDTILTKEFDDNGVLLSGGEIQRLSIARALNSNAAIKIFDEPSSALDPIAEDEIYQYITADKKDRIVLFISHRLSSVQDCDCVFLIENGIIIEKGTHNELIQRGEKYAKMYNMQAINYLALSDREGILT